MHAENLYKGWLVLDGEKRVRLADLRQFDVYLGPERPFAVVLVDRSLHATSVNALAFSRLLLRTVHARSLRLGVSEWIVRWPRRCIHAWRSMRVWSWLATLLLKWRSQARSTVPTTSHDALEQIRRAVSYRGRRLLRRAYMRTLGCTSSRLEFAPEAVDFVFVSASSQTSSI